MIACIYLYVPARCTTLHTCSAIVTATAAISMLVVAEDKAFTKFDSVRLYEWENVYRVLITIVTSHASSRRTHSDIAARSFVMSPSIWGIHINMLTRATRYGDPAGGGLVLPVLLCAGAGLTMCLYNVRMVRIERRARLDRIVERIGKQRAEIRFFERQLFWNVHLRIKRDPPLAHHALLRRLWRLLLMLCIPPMGIMCALILLYQDQRMYIQRINLSAVSAANRGTQSRHRSGKTAASAENCPDLP